jgi:hypothetical protein
LDLPASGYHAALRAAERFLAGELGAACTALEQALALDGETAPLLLMQAVLDGVVGEEERAVEAARQVTARWGGSPPGELARAWLSLDQTYEVLEASGVLDATLRIPFPSAIRPVIHLRPGSTWQARARAGGVGAASVVVIE